MSNQLLKVDKWIYFDDLLKSHPECKQFFNREGICVTGIPFFGSLEQFLAEIGRKDIDDFVARLNNHLNSDG